MPENITSRSPESEPQPPDFSREIADMLQRELGPDYGFDDETIEEIAALPFEEAFAMAYNYLVQAGADADEVLAPWME
ncbi:hypothetical protein JNJ66_00095 [Candidatus Saccharibacteria bacterium]|nr:hypothetical protein [Candidatus Saccharibacteria bacterium]